MKKAVKVTQVGAEDVRALLAKGPMTVAQMAKAMKKSDHAVYRRLRAASSEGLKFTTVKAPTGRPGVVPVAYMLANAKVPARKAVRK